MLLLGTGTCASLCMALCLSVSLSLCVCARARVSGATEAVPPNSSAGAVSLHRLQLLLNYSTGQLQCSLPAASARADPRQRTPDTLMNTPLGGSILFTENCGHGLPALAETSIQSRFPPIGVQVTRKSD